MQAVYPGGMTDVPEYKRAIIDWIVAHGEPIATFGTGGRLAAERSRADLAQSGIDYAQSTLGDLAGLSWCHDTYADAQVHPGLWADVVPVGGHSVEFGQFSGVGDQERWFVDTSGYGITLDMVIQQALEAGQQGDAYWRRLVTEEQAAEAVVRAERLAVWRAAEAKRRGMGGPPKGALP